ncbi:phosphatase domain-containing protein [uncultured Georgenia sp.]|uniref:App1 family protein n=1 Tax=uncultured Georgenia sp. TaxID=378209 RepID=UPI00261F61EA|nr:phosphatase domain-containing protein [uncultured Georgenia sp.]
MARTGIAANLEDSVNRRLIPYLKEHGWRPATIPYTGYGNADTLRVLARVLLRAPDDTAPAAADVGATSRELAEAEEAERGWQSFLTAPVAYLPVAVEIGGRTHQARADRGGYLDVLVPDHGLPAGRHEISVHARGAKPVTAQVLVIGPETRVGIVSDIDDTVMVTRVPRPLVAAWNTFVRHTTARQPVPGMAELFRRLGSALPGAPVFYLSTGAWNVVPALERFFRRSGLPTGPMLMTDWGPTNTGWFRSGQEHKRTTLRRLLIDFPHVRWLLIGDDGQHDPEIYAELAREHPDRVVAIGIRRLTAGEHVLAHGTPQASDMGKGHDGGRVSGRRQVPAVAGPDGESLWRELRPYL